MKSIALLLAVLLLPPAALADEDERRYNLVRLQAERVEHVSNDTMHVSLNTYGEDRDASQLAKRINTDMKWALQQVAAYKTVKAKKLVKAAQAKLEEAANKISAEKAGASIDRLVDALKKLIKASHKLYPALP